MTDRRLRSLALSLAVVVPACSGDANPVAQGDDPTPEVFETLHELVAARPGRVLHGWGQSGNRWESEAVPYFREVGVPTLVSDYVSMERLGADPDALTDLTRMGSWTAGDGTTHRFIVMQCLTNEFDPKDLIQALLDLGYDLDPSDPDVQDEVRRLLEDPDVRAAVVEIVGFPDENVAEGERDDEIVRLARAVAQVPHPVLVRFTQEFVGGIHKDDVSGPETFKRAWIRFVELMREHGAANAEFVWHPNEGDDETLESWWPGDAYVDWVAISVFRGENFQEAFDHSRFAARHGKPFMIAESAPTLGEFADRGTEDAATWDDFFVPYFELVKGDDNLAAFVYINIDWDDSRFDWPTSRVQENGVILERYRAELDDGAYLTGEELWSGLGR